MRTVMAVIAVLLAVELSSPARPTTASTTAKACSQPRNGDNAAMSPAGNGWTYLYGGDDRSLWRWTGSRWARAENSHAPGLYSSALAAEPDGTGLLLIGDTTLSRRVRLGMWRWQDGRWTHLNPARLPTGGYDNIQLSLADDRVHHELLLAESVVNAQYATQNELWGWAGSTWRRLRSDTAGEITGSSVPYPIATGPRGWVYGFEGTVFSRRRLVRWNGTRFEPVEMSGAPISVAALALAPNDGSLIVLGSRRPAIPDGAFPTHATYRFDGSRWTSTPLPNTLRFWVGMLVALDPKHGTDILWGGTRSVGFSPRPAPTPATYPATWRWTGAQWVRAQRTCA